MWWMSRRAPGAAESPTVRGDSAKRNGYARALYDYLVLFYGYGLLAAICLAWSLSAVVLSSLLVKTRGRELGRRVIMRGFQVYLEALRRTGAFRFELSNLDALREERSLIVAPNHPGLLDAVMILSRLPNVSCVMKSQLMDSVLFGAGARLARFIRNDSAHGMIKQAIRELGRGSHLLLFPEGTRTTRHPVNPVKGSVGLIAQRAQVVVQTLIIESDSEFLGKHWPLLRRPEFPISFRVRLGRRFSNVSNARAFSRELEQYFSTELGSGERRPSIPIGQEAATTVTNENEHPLVHASGVDTEL